MLLIALLLLQPDPCSYLNPAEMAKEFNGVSFSAPTHTPAPPAYRGQAAGTKCDYAGTRGFDVQLIVYVDASPDEAKRTFESLMAWFPATSKPSGIGDEAYIDKNHAIHVLKGKTRFFIDISPGADAKREQQARDFATSVVAKL